MPVDFKRAFCVTQSLKNLPCNYWPTEKPLSAALDTVFNVTASVQSNEGF